MNIELDEHNEYENRFEKEFLKPMYAKSNLKSQENFQENPFGFECNVCDRLWFLNYSYLDDLISKTNCIELLSKEFPEENVENFKACSNCLPALRKNKIPNMSRSNGFKYPLHPTHLPELNVIIN